MPRSPKVVIRPAISVSSRGSEVMSRMVGRLAKKFGEVRLQRSSSFSQPSSGSVGASTKATNERPRKRIDCRD